MHNVLRIIKNNMRVFGTVAYICHHLSDDYADVSDDYVNLSDIYGNLSDLYVDWSENYHID